MYRFCLSVGLWLGVVVIAYTQQLTPAQKAELDKLSREAKAEFERAMDPANMARGFDEQIEESRKNGATPAQIQELEKAKADALKRLREMKAAPTPPEPADAAPNADNSPALAGLQQRLARADSLPVPVQYDERPGRYGPVPESFRVYAEARLTPEGFVAFMQKQYGVTLREESDATFDGLRTVQYAQVHAGYAVRMARYVATINAEGFVVRAGGLLFALTAPAATFLTPAQLLTKLRTATRMPALVLHDSLRADDLTPMAIARPLVWVSPGLNPARPPELARPFSVVGSNYGRRWYLNARTGAVLATETTRLSCFAPPPAKTRPMQVRAKTFHHGLRPVNVVREDNYGKPILWLIDSTAKPVVQLVKASAYDPANYAKILQYTTDTTLGGVYTAKGVNDVLFGLRTAATFYQKRGFNSYDGRGSAITAFPISKDNAYWSSEYQQIQFGTYQNKPLTVLSIMGHELTHAVIEHSAGLIYQGESGAINESIADMMGLSIEHQTLGGNWTLLEEVFPPAKQRSVDNPKSTGHPDTYGEQNWRNPADTTFDHGGVHVNSGVGNKWFALIVKGGKGQNDLKQAYDVKEPLGLPNATRLVLATLRLLTPGTDYDFFCQTTIDVAESLFGVCSPQAQTVKQAWYAVGVLDDPPVACKPGWMFRLTAPGAAQSIQYYVRGDSIVAIARTDESIGKIYTRRSSAFLNVVTQDSDGLHTSKAPKAWGEFLEKTVTESLPMQEAALAQRLAEARAELADPATSAERRSELQKSIPMVEDFARQAKQGRAELMKDLKDMNEGNRPQSEMEFWQGRAGRRQFDKDYSRAAPTLYEGKYLARRYTLTSEKHLGSGSFTWLSTAQIPLRFSDLVFFTPVALPQQKRPGIDYFLRGFPLEIMGMTIQNIKESVPANFNALFSDAPVFQ